ncbi:MAG TPA: hypothetical protein VFH52_08665, partial [Rhodanobacteraceae bacterium]|nr:hypothetical protein [Rhodanobacteraceae bacterium]
MATTPAPTTATGCDTDGERHRSRATGDHPVTGRCKSYRNERVLQRAGAGGIRVAAAGLGPAGCRERADHESGAPACGSHGGRTGEGGRSAVACLRTQ